MLALCIPHPWVRPHPGQLALLGYQGPISLPVLGPRVADRMIRLILQSGRGDESLSDTDVAIFAEHIPPRVTVAMYRTFLTRELLPIARGRYAASVLEVPTTVLLGDRDLVTRTTPRGPVDGQPLCASRFCARSRTGCPNSGHGRSSTGSTRPCHVTSRRRTRLRDKRLSSASETSGLSPFRHYPAPPRHRAVTLRARGARPDRSSPSKAATLTSQSGSTSARIRQPSSRPRRSRDGRNRRTRIRRWRTADHRAGPNRRRRRGSALYRYTSPDDGDEAMKTARIARHRRQPASLARSPRRRQASRPEARTNSAHSRPCP